MNDQRNIYEGDASSPTHPRLNEKRNIFEKDGSSPAENAFNPTPGEARINYNICAAASPKLHEQRSPVHECIVTETAKLRAMLTGFCGEVSEAEGGELPDDIASIGRPCFKTKDVEEVRKKFKKE